VQGKIGCMSLRGWFLRPVLIALLLSALSAEVRALTILPVAIPNIRDVHPGMSPPENGHGGFAYLATALSNTGDPERGCLEAL
jgi:hypothetical protein